MTEQELLQVPEELREIFRGLDEQGWQPVYYDTPVPYYDGRVPCGTPHEVGDICPDGYMMLPHGTRDVEAIFGLSVRGDSMVGAGIESGDKLDVLSTPMVSDGDVVVAIVDGSYTVKVFITDEKGQRWLSPCNKRHKPIRLTSDMDVVILGRVVGIHKGAPRPSCAEILRDIRETELREIAQQSCGTESLMRPAAVVCSVADMVKQARQWYAVYRAMVDRHVWGRGEYAEFVDMVASAVPQHEHLPTVVELRRMAVDSFSRAVAFWDSNNAPVSGARFDAYMRIARATAAACAEEDEE